MLLVEYEASSAKVMGSIPRKLDRQIKCLLQPYKKYQKNQEPKKKNHKYIDTGQPSFLCAC